MVTTENRQNSFNHTVSTSNDEPIYSDPTESNTTDDTFFKELEGQMREKPRATITTLSSYDPIDELDALIDQDDLNRTFHDPLDELYEDNEMLEFTNPNLKLPIFKNSSS